MSDYEEHLAAQFARAKSQALAFVESWNSRLPTDACPFCHSTGHVPGLPCPECSHVHDVSWSILMDTEWGYSVIALGNPRQIYAEFNVSL